jgi:hypothetical protein
MTDEKRLTAEQVAKNFEATAEAMALSRMNSTAEIYYDATRLVRDNLVPRWQDEPDADDARPHWVEGLSDRMPVLLYRSDDGRWLLSGAIPLGDVWIDIDGEDLIGRRVCPIGDRPKEGE